MNPKDAEKLGIKEGDGVWLISPYCKHKVRAKARVTILCQPGLIDAQYGWRGDQETQHLIPRKDWDPISGYRAATTSASAWKRHKGGSSCPVTASS